jgi:hypothetical protein
MKPLLGCLFSVILLTTTATVHGDTLFDRYFANADGGKPCYTRIYDAQHLRRNPNQKVRQITLAFDLTKPGRDKPVDAHQFEVALGLRVRDMTELFFSPADCSTERSGIACRVEGDGGTFLIRPGQEDGLTIEVIGDGLRFEGESDAIEVGGKKSEIIVSYCRASIPCDAASGSGMASRSERVMP